MSMPKLLVMPLILINQVLCQKEGYFLPKAIKPLHYTLTLEPVSLTNYRGSVSIQLEALEGTSNITLHAKLLDIPNNSVKIYDVDGNQIAYKNIIEDVERDFYIIILAEKLQKGGKYRLDIEKFRGIFSESRIGFYIEKFENLNKSEGFMALSDFQPLYARETFPCFDEPHLKATFLVSLIRSSSTISASNSPLAQTLYLGNDRYQDVYKKTPPMSTYIVAFIICNLQYTKQNGKIRLLVRPQFLSDGSTDFILEESVNILRAMEEYTGIRYLLDKLDIVGVINKVGGMENWGLITFDERYLICPNSSSTMAIQICFIYNVHEIAHQWFGNLVSPRSWHYMWLNEGFATYFQYFMADKLKSDWRLSEQYVVDEFQRSLREDNLPMTEPMDFIFEENFMFPASIISYQKASTIIRMTTHVLTENIFHKSLRLYLNTFQLKVTEPKDLYDCYKEIVHLDGMTHLLGGLNIHDIISSWAKNPGYPVVNVTRNYHTGEVTFSQQSSDFSSGSIGSIWYIPLTYGFQSDINFDTTTADLWMINKSITINAGETRGWLLANKQVAGYYRATYDIENWKRLINFLRTEDYELIPPVNRAQLVDDAFFFLVNKKLDIDIFLNLISYLVKEQDYIPIKSYLTNIDNIFQLSEVRRDEEAFGTVKGYLITLLKASLDSVGLHKRNADTHVDRLKRDELLKMFCKLGDFRCRLKGKRMLTEWKTTGKPVNGYDMEMWLCAAMQKPEIELWNFLVKQYHIAVDETLRQKYITALTCADSMIFKQRFLALIFDLNNNMKSQERTDGLASFVRHTYKGTMMIIKYVKDKNLDNSYFSLFRNAADRYLLLPTEFGKMHGAEDRKILNRLRIAFFLDEQVNERVIAKLIERFPFFQNTFR